MQNIKIKFLAIGFTALGLGACTNLETVEKDSVISESSTGVPKVKASDAITNAYNSLGDYVNQENVYAMQAHVSDEMIPPTRGTDWGDNGVWRTLDQHTWNPEHAMVTNSWNQLNERVFKATIIIENSDPVATTEQLANAKFLRAFSMMQVMDYFGQVPFREVSQGVDDLPKVLTRSEAFDFVVKDLTDAVANLPVKGPNASNNRGSKAAANALLARLFLNKGVYKGTNAFDGGDMDKVISYCKAVTDNGYSLDNDYFNNFTGGAAREPIFTTDQGNFQSRWYMTLHYDQTPGGWNGFTTLADFYKKFEAGDQRKGFYKEDKTKEFSWIGKGFLLGQQRGPKKTDKGDIIKDADGNYIIEDIIEARSKTPLVFKQDVSLSGATTQQGIRVIKYHPGDKKEYIFLRYADVFLMNAEALFRKNDKAGALKEVNTLRKSRGAADLTDLTADGLLDELGREKYWEGGRRTDQIRFGTFTRGVANTGAHTVLYPIPSAALVSNSKLVQNPGYSK